MNKITELEERIKAITKEVEELKKQETKFEVGKWYTDGKKSFLYLQSEYKYGVCGVGFCAGKWVNDWYGKPATDELRLATEQEVSSALIDEAKRRYKDGDKFIQEYDFDSFGKPCNPKKLQDTIKGSFKIWENKQSKYNLISDGDGLIFNGKTGKWAEIIKEEKITIGGYEVKFENLNTELAFSTIDGHLFTYEFWSAASVISNNSKAKIMIGCSKQFDVSIDVINKILDKLK